MTSKDYYVYCWKNIKSGDIFYIGFGKGNRYKSKRKRNSEFLSYIEKYYSEPFIIKEGLTEEEAKVEEKKLIEYYWGIGQAKTNLKAGGCGGNTFSLLSKEKQIEFKSKISVDSKRKWENKNIRDKITGSVIKAMDNKEIRDKISERTKIGMRNKENWDKFIKSRANTVSIRIEDEEEQIFESLSKSLIYLKEKFPSISFSFLGSKQRPSLVYKETNNKTIRIEITNNKTQVKSVTTICDECNRVEKK